MPSIRIKSLPCMSKPRISATSSATSTTWNTDTHRCHIAGRILWKSTRRNVVNRIRLMNSGRMVSKIGSITSLTGSRAGIQ